MSGSDSSSASTALKRSLTGDTPPAGIDGPLAALWHAGKGNFQRARELLDKDLSPEAAWVRAHLHRRQDQPDQAADWYEKAGRQASTDPIETEWGQIAVGLMWLA